MRRAGGLWPQVVAFDNLCRAARRAARGKRHVAGVARFLDRLEPEVLALQRDLEGGTWRPGRPTTFRILDPKERTITAAPFADRVVHHALIDVLEPFLDRRMVFESFACRRGKGTHAAIRHAQRLLRRHDFFLKMDVRQCFASIESEVVLETLSHILKDRRVVALCATILEGPAPAQRGGDPCAPRGLPIGNLTSQWFANLVLDRLDHHVKEQLRIPGYARYMDDFVLFSSDRDRLRAARVEVEAFLAERLHLRAKPSATILGPAWRGLPFLGWQIHRGVLRLRPANLRRMRRRLRQRLWEHRKGLLEDDALAASLRSVVSHLEHGTTRALRRSIFENLGLDRPGSPGSPPRPLRQAPPPSPAPSPGKAPGIPGAGPHPRATAPTAAAAGTTPPRTRARRTATRTRPRTATTNSAFAPPRHLASPIAPVLPLGETAAPCTPMPRPASCAAPPPPRPARDTPGAGRRGLARRGS